MKGVIDMKNTVDVCVVSGQDLRRIFREELGGFLDRLCDKLRLNDQLLEAKEAADVLGVKTRTVWQWRKEGRLPYVEISKGSFRFRKSELEEFLAQRTKKEPTPSEHVDRIGRGHHCDADPSRGHVADFRRVG